MYYINIIYTIGSCTICKSSECSASVTKAPEFQVPIEQFDKSYRICPLSDSSEYTVAVIDYSALSFDLNSH